MHTKIPPFLAASNESFARMHLWQTRAAGVHECAARAAGLQPAQIRCQACGRLQTVNGSAALADGWPVCHGHTMSLVR